MAVDKIVWKILLDILVLALLGIPLLVLVIWMEPYHRGYFQTDLSIRLPYKPESISPTVLAVFGFSLIILTVLITEIVRNKKGKNIGKKFLSGSVVPGWMWESYTTIGVFTFGASCQQLTTYFAKYVVGRLRPHFIDVCNPFINSSTTLNSLGYIQDYECLSTNVDLVKAARLSFPSAHTSFAMYTAVFFVLYVQAKGKWRGSKLLHHGVQFAAVMGAWYAGLTRVQEHFHHWSDIAAGYAIGASVGILVFIFVLKPKKYGLPTSWDEPAQPNALPRPALAR